MNKYEAGLVTERRAQMHHETQLNAQREGLGTAEYFKSQRPDFRPFGMTDVMIEIQGDQVAVALLANGEMHQVSESEEGVVYAAEDVVNSVAQGQGVDVRQVAVTGFEHMTTHVDRRDPVTHEVTQRPVNEVRVQFRSNGSNWNSRVRSSGILDPNGHSAVVQAVLNGYSYGAWLNKVK